MVINRVPYTDFHNTNLDWIIEKVKEGEVSISEFKKVVDAIPELTKQQAIEKIEELITTGEFGAMIETAIETLETNVSAEIAAEIAARETGIAEVGDRVTEVGDRVTENETEIVTLRAKVADIPSIVRGLSAVPTALSKVDSFDSDNGLYVAGSNVSSGSAVMSTTNKTLSITKGGTGDTYLSSIVTNYRTLVGKNIIINTTMLVDFSTSQYPQIHLRANQYDEIGAFVLFFGSATTAFLNQITATAVMTGRASAALDSTGFTTADVSARVYEDMVQFVIRQGGKITANMRYKNPAVKLIEGAINGFSGNSTAIYKNYIKSSVIKNFINVVCVGDSNTAGNGLTLKQTYPAILQGHFFEHNVGVLNMGASGYKTTDVMTQLPSIHAQNITGARNIAVLMIGTNDIAAGVNVAQTYTNMETIIADLKDNNYEVWLVTIPARTNVELMADITELNDLILSNQTADRIIDLYSQTVDKTSSIISGILQGDGVHLTEKACAIFAGIVAEELGQ